MGAGGGGGSSSKQQREMDRGRSRSMDLDWHRLGSTELKYIYGKIIIIIRRTATNIC